KIVVGMAKPLQNGPDIAHVVPKIFARVTHRQLPGPPLPTNAPKQSQEQIAMAARKTMTGFAAYRPTVVFKTPIGGGESNAWPILVNLYGPDLRTLSGYALRVNERLSSLPQFIDVKARVNLGNPELRVDVDRQRAADLGVRVASLASALRLMVSGEDEITSYREDGERYPVKMRVREGGGALSGEDARPRRAAQRRPVGRRPDGGVELRRAGPDRQRRAARTRRGGGVDYPAGTAARDRRLRRPSSPSA